MAAQTPPPPTLDEDTTDDILYAVRTNDLASLTTTLSAAAQSLSTSESHILAAARSRDQSTPLHYAAANAHAALLAHLLSLSPPGGAWLDARNAAGSTALHWAALNGHLACVTLLVRAGADMWVRNAAGNVAVFEAERADKGDVVAFLLVEGGREGEEKARLADGGGEEGGDAEMGEGREGVEEVRRGVEGVGMEE